MPLQLRFSVPSPSPNHSSTFRLPSTSRSRRRFTLLVLFACFALLISLSILILQTASHANAQVDNLLSSSKKRIKGWSDDWSTWRVGKEDTIGNEEAWLESIGDVVASHEDDMVVGNIEESCHGWDPEADEKDDPVDCLRSRQYRQVQRVLAREEKAEHPHWYFTVEHNLQVLHTLLLCFLPPSHPSSKNCPPKPLVLSGWWYTAEVITGATTGEVIWQTGLMKALEQLGLYYIAVGPYLNWITVAEMMPDVYRVIWNSDIDTVSCLTDPRCVAKDHYVPPLNATDLSIGVPDEERGVIPIWALNVVDYWGSRPKEMSNNDYWWGLTEDGDWSYQPLGPQWIATPWPLPGHVHLPYSIEEYCLPLPVTPHAERNGDVLILAKRSSYFDYHYVTPRDHWTNLSHEPSFNLLLTANEEDDHPLPDGLVTLGGHTREKYEQLVGSVKALLGMGAPPISPSVYTALCQATPVIMPYFLQNLRTDGWHLYSGFLQHGPAMAIGEPYVYSYLSNNYTDLLAAINRAISTPINRYIPPDMTFECSKSQLSTYLNRDLQAMFRKVLVENGGKVPRLIAGARETCYKFDRCRAELEVGRIPAVPGGKNRHGVIKEG